MNAHSRKPKGTLDRERKQGKPRIPEPVGEGISRVMDELTAKDDKLSKRIEQIRKSKDKKALPELIELLGYRTSVYIELDIRSQAFEAIMEIGLDDEAIEILAEVVENEKFPAVSAAKIFAWASEEKGLEAFCGALGKREFKEDTYGFIFVPDKFGYEKKKRLIELIGHDGAEVRSGAHHLLKTMIKFSRNNGVFCIELDNTEFAKMAREHAIDGEPGFVHGVRLYSNECGEMDWQTTDKMVALLTDAYVHAENWDTTYILAKWILEINRPESDETFEAVGAFKEDAIDLHGDDDRFRRIAIVALAKMIDHGVGIDAVYETLLELSSNLSSTDISVVRRALNGLGSMHEVLRRGDLAESPFYEPLKGLHQGMLSNPSREERMLMAESFQALVKEEMEQIIRETSD